MATKTVKQQQDASSHFLNSLKNLQQSVLLCHVKSAKFLAATHKIPLVDALRKANATPIPLVDALRKASADPEIKRAVEYFHNFPLHIRNALLTLGEHGWYFDSGLSISKIRDVVDTFSDGNMEEAENALIEHFENSLSEIEEGISKKFPSREKLIKDAFNAYREQKYELAILALLAQADGICKDATGKYLFIKDSGKKRPGIASYVDKLDENSYEAALHSALTKTLPINASTSERTDGLNALNRHQIFHGESLDYGSKINGLKAISLINYVACLLPSDSERF